MGKMYRDVFLQQAVNGLFTAHGELAALADCLKAVEAEGDDQLETEVRNAVKYLRRLRERLHDARYASPASLTVKE